MEIKTSWAVWPFLAIALYPLIVLTDILMVKCDALPLTLEIEAGVTVLICSLDANFFKTGIRPSIYVLWVITILPNIKIIINYSKSNSSKSWNLHNYFYWAIGNFIKLIIIFCSWTFVILWLLDQLKMIFQIGWAALAAIFTFSIAMVVWGRNGDGSIDI